MSKKEKILLALIVVLAFFLRFYKLNQNPPSLTWDEASLGYNAYSLLKTGKDEHGRTFPFDYFISFGDYKPPVAVYTTLLPTAIFGLNEFSTRAPSALFGTLTVLITYFLVKELFFAPSRRCFNTSEESFQATIRGGLPLFSSFLLAISPWHILLSRACFEANIATFFVVLGTYFFIKALREKSKYLLLSSFSYLLSFYTFNTPRVFVPLFLAGLAFIYRKRLLKIKKWVLTSIIFGVILIAPLLPHLFSPEGQLRFREVNIFTDLEVIKQANRRIEAAGGGFLARVIYNRRIGYALLFARHFLDHFNPTFLFFSGDVNPKFSIQDIGQLYLIEAPFLLLGFYFLFEFGKREALMIVWWLFSGLVPAGTARETPHALRTLVTLPTWQIIITFGILGFFRTLKDRRLKRIFYFLLFTFYFLLLFYFLHNYFVHYPKKFSREWQYGYKEMVLFVKKIYKNYDQVLVSDVYGRPYIYFLYYLQYPPSEYQKEAVRERNVFGQYKVKGFGKFRFGNLEELISKANKGKILLIGRPESISKKAKILKRINFLNGKPAFLIGEITL